MNWIPDLLSSLSHTKGPVLSDAEVAQRATIRTLIERAPTADEVGVDSEGDVTITWAPVAGDRTHLRVVLMLWRLNVRVRISTLKNTYEFLVPAAEVPEAQEARQKLVEKARSELCARALKRTERK